MRAQHSKTNLDRRDHDRLTLLGEISTKPDKRESISARQISVERIRNCDLEPDGASAGQPIAPPFDTVQRAVSGIVLGL